MICLAGYDNCSQIALMGYAPPCDSKTSKPKIRYPQKTIYTRHFFIHVYCTCDNFLLTPVQIVMHKKAHKSFLNYASVNRNNKVNKNTAIRINQNHKTNTETAFTIYSTQHTDNNVEITTHKKSTISDTVKFKHGIKDDFLIWKILKQQREKKNDEKASLL